LPISHELKWNSTPKARFSFLAVYLKDHLRLRGEQAHATARCLEGGKKYEQQVCVSWRPNLMDSEAFCQCPHHMACNVYEAPAFLPGFIYSYIVIKP
jgi:hypothetical protein